MSRGRTELLAASPSGWLSPAREKKGWKEGCEKRGFEEEGLVLGGVEIGRAHV